MHISICKNVVLASEAQFEAYRKTLNNIDHVP